VVQLIRGFGKWSWDVSFDPNDIGEILKKHSKE
jgi:hypothetical protein